MPVRDVKKRKNAPLATPPDLSGRTKIAGLITLASFSLTILLTGMERLMADATVARRVLQVEHITIKTTKKFAEVEAALEGAFRSSTTRSQRHSQAATNSGRQSWNVLRRYLSS